MSRLLEVKGLHADLRLPAGALHAVRNVSFSMDRGETLSLVGESGCGKSMTALAIMDLLPPRGIRWGKAVRVASGKVSPQADRVSGS